MTLIGRSSAGRALLGKSILLTGGTGFLGKVIVERLLCTAPEIDRIYLLIRAPHQADAVARFDAEVFPSGAFAPLATLLGEGWSPFVRSKLVPVAGDVSLPRLGLADEVHALLTRRVDIIINSAASVTFDAPIDEALRNNTHSARHIADFARACRAAALIHISTAFVAGRRHGRISEGPLAIDEAELESADQVVDALVEDHRHRPRRDRERRTHLSDAGMTRAKSLGWYDSYTYTKALGETALSLHRGDVPTAIVRPTIIESSLLEPVPGWLENLNVADPIFVEFGRGRMPEFPLGAKTILDIVPVDLVANAVVALLPRLPEPGRSIAYYTIGSGATNPLTGLELYELTYDYFLRNPMLDRRGRAIPPPQWTFPTPERFREMYAHTRPGTTLKRLLYLADLYESYTNAESVFETDNIRRLFDDLDDSDRAMLDFDVRRVEWRTYIHDIHLPGLKRHILGDAPPAHSEFGVHV